MQTLHEFPHIASIFDVSEKVIVIVEQRDDPQDESEFLRVMEESIPENRFGFFGLEDVRFLATARRQEVDAVVAIPVLEAVLSVVELVG